MAGSSLPPSSAKKCEKHRRLVADLQVNLSATGDKPTNNLVAFLTCEVKCGPSLKSFKPILTAYEKCHNSVMGTGRFPETGRSHCGEELGELLTALQGGQ